MKKIYLLFRKNLILSLRNLFLFLLLGLNVSVFAQNNQGNERKGEDEKYRIGITTGSFIPEKTTEFSFLLPNTGVYYNKYFRLVQFYNLPTDEQRKTWENAGMFLTDYLPGNTYFAVIDENFSLGQLQNVVRAIFPVDARFKKEAEIFYHGIPDYAIKNGKAELIISYYATLNAEMIMTDLRSKGVDIKNHRNYSRQLDIAIDPLQLEFIVGLPYIQFVGSISDEPINEAENLAYRNPSGRANYLNTGYNGLTYNGSGVVIAIGEGGTIDNTVDFKGRFTELVTGSAASHKLGCMGNAAGAGNLDPTNRSNAWGATLLSTDNENYPALITTYNARYFNHSYGVGIQGGYDLDARDHDLRIATHPNHLVSYSSGNDGTNYGYAPYNTFQSWGNLTGKMKQNKNHLVVKNLSPNDDIIDWGCSGPSYDGRVFPHLIIAGPEGTSYASPKAVGVFGILEQAYKANHGGTESPSSLLKAIIMNSADDMDDPGPDFRSGYGRPNVRRAYNIIINNQHLTSSVANGVTNSHTITVPANTKQVRVMVMWPDVAAAVNANPAIVNNLNLVGKDPSLTSYNPWILDHTANPANLDLPAVRGIDNINTVEQVTVDNPAAGNWTFQVNGASVPSGPQTYYLVYEFLMDGLYMGFPLKDERFKSGDTYYIKWDSYGTTGTFNLDYQLDGGSWVNIASGIGAAIRSFSWIAPVVSGIHTVKFRVQRGAVSAESDVNYIGAVPENFRITKVCSDVVTLKWSPVTGATSYKVYRLGTSYMEEVTLNITFNANSAILTGQSTTGSEYYAVSAVTGSYEGLRTNAIEKVAGDYGCTSISWNGTISTDWFTTGNWSSGALPLISENVVIPSTAPNQPAISAAGAVCNNITIDNGASLTMNASTAYTLSVAGDWVNNGTFVRGIGTVEFSSTNGYQEIGGASTTGFYILSVAKGAQTKILEATGLITLHAATNPLNLVSGTFKLSSASTITPFTNGTGADLGSTEGLWNNGGTINSGNFSWSLNGGLLRVSAGAVNAGTSTGNTITYLNGGSITVEGGVLNIAGRFSPNSGTSLGSYTQYGGAVTVNTAGSTSTTRAPFELNSGAPFTMNGGSLIIQRASSNATADFIISSSTVIVTGGTIQIGNNSTPAGQTFRINSVAPFYNFVVNANNAPTAQLVTNGLTVKQDVTISGGTLNANNLDMNVGGHWANNGTFTPGSGTVTFNGTIAQNIGGSNATTFNNLTLNNANGITLTDANASANGTVLFTDGVISTGTNKLIITSSGSVSRTSGHVFGNLQKNVSTGTSIGRTFEIGDAALANYTPVSVTFASVTAAGNLIAKTINGDHPNIATSTLNASKSVNRYWALTNSGIAFTDYSSEFTFLSGDVDASVNTNNLLCGKFNSPTWTYPSIGTRTATTTQITGLSSFSDFQLAELNCVSPDVPTISASTNPICAGSNTTLSVTAGNLNDATTWTWYTGSCGGTLAGIGALLQVSPTASTTFYVRGEGGCVTPGACAEIIITITNPLTPAFAQLGPYNQGTQSDILPTTSSNGITGTWSPAYITTSTVGTTTYTFTPTAGQCATTTTMDIVVNAVLVSFSFSQDIGTALLVAWPTIPGASFYYIQYSLTPNGPWIGKSSTTNNCKIVNYSPGITYYWRVCGYNAGGYQIGIIAADNPYTTNTVSFLTTKDIGTTLELSWDDYSTWASSYVLQYKIDGGAWKSFTTYTNEKKISGLTPGTTYYVRIAVYKAGYLWGYSSGNTTFTAKPVTFNPTNISSTGLTLTWNNFADDLASWVSYSVLYYRPQNTTGAWGNKAIHSASNTTSLTGLTAGTTYDCYVIPYYQTPSIVWGPTSNGTFSTAGAKQSNSYSEASVYPNPFTNEIHISLFAESETNANWKIYDMTGKLVLSGDQKFSSGNNEMKIDGTLLPKGVYTLTTLINDKLENVRLIKQ